MHKDISRILYTQEDLNKICKKLGEQISKDYEGKNLLLIAILKGSIHFMSDLSRYITVPCKFEFISASSYGSGSTSSGTVKITSTISESLEPYDVLLVEDILDTGNTLKKICQHFEAFKPNSINIVTLLDKPERRVTDVYAKYSGAEVPDEFVVGYGLDYNQRYRNLSYIGVLKREIYE